MTLLGAEARELRAALASAPDDKLGRIVRVLDGLVDRSDTDQLLAVVRPRLRWLRPARPLRFARLLALPLEGALVPPGNWNRAADEIPRSALAPLAEAMHAALGEAAEVIEVAACGHNDSETGLIGELGRRLWPLAGAIAQPPLPTGWEAASLPRDAVVPVLALATALWRHGPALWRARLAGPAGPPEALVQATLAAVAREGEAPLAAATRLLLRHAAAPARVAAIAGRLSPRLAAMVERELAVELTRHAGTLAEATTPAMAEAAVALDDRLADAEAVEAPAHRETRRRLAARLRHAAGEACRARFAEALRTELLEPAALLAACPAAADAAVQALEATARDLRRLEAAGRRLAPEAGFTRDLAEAVPRLAALADAPGLGRVEVARLIEIVAGPEAALPVLRR